MRQARNSPDVEEMEFEIRASNMERDVLGRPFMLKGVMRRDLKAGSAAMDVIRLLAQQANFEDC